MTCRDGVVDVDERQPVHPGQQPGRNSGEPGQHPGMDRVELADVAEGERAQERPQPSLGRRGPHVGEDLGHPAVPQHVEVSRQTRWSRRWRASPRRSRTPSPARSDTERLDAPPEQVVQPSLLCESHHRDQTGRTDQVRVIENRGYLVRCLHLSDAPSDGCDQTLDKCNPPAPQGHSHITTRPTRPPIGGSGLSRPHERPRLVLGPSSLWFSLRIACSD